MKKAFTLIEILIVVSIIGLISAIAVPSFFKYRSSANNQMKEVNLSNIDAAKDQFAIMHNKQYGYSLSTDDKAEILEYLGNGIQSENDLIVVPGDTLNWNPIGSNATYSTP